MDRTGEEMDGLRALADVACAVAEGASGGSAGAARVLGPDLTTPRRVAGGGAEDEGEAFTAGAAAAGGVQRPGEYPAVWGSQPPGWQQNLVCNSDKDSDLRCFFDAIDDCFLLLASRKTALGATAKAADWQAQDGCSNKTHPVGLLRVKGVTTDPRHNPSVFHAIDALVCAGYGNCKKVETRGNSGGKQWLRRVTEQKLAPKTLGVVASAEKRGALDAMNGAWGGPICSLLVRQLLAARRANSVEATGDVRMQLLLNAGLDYAQTFVQARHQTGIVDGQCRHRKTIEQCTICGGRFRLYHALGALQSELQAGDDAAVLPALAFSTAAVASLHVPDAKDTRKRDRSKRDKSEEQGGGCGSNSKRARTGDMLLMGSLSTSPAPGCAAVTPVTERRATVGGVSDGAGASALTVDALLGVEVIPLVNELGVQVTDVSWSMPSSYHNTSSRQATRQVSVELDPRAGAVVIRGAAIAARDPADAGNAAAGAGGGAGWSSVTISPLGGALQEITNHIGRLNLETGARREKRQVLTQVIDSAQNALSADAPCGDGGGVFRADAARAGQIEAPAHILGLRTLGDFVVRRNVGPLTGTFQVFPMSRAGRVRVRVWHVSQVPAHCCDLS